MNIINHKEKKTLVVLAIEHTLLQISNATLEKVEKKIHDEYNGTLADCYEHPEYLNKVLKGLFGESYLEIVKSINKYLDDFTYQEPIAEFLKKISE